MSTIRPVRSQVSGPGLGDPLTLDLTCRGVFLTPLTYRSGPGLDRRSELGDDPCDLFNLKTIRNPLIFRISIFFHFGYNGLLRLHILTVLS
jgi:hypothetical protein